MDVEIGKASAPETPASSMTGYVTELVTGLMNLGGIESISATKYACGFGSRLHVTIAPFADAPEEVKSQGVVIKDAIATIMSIANITRIVMNPSEKDLGSMREGWNQAMKEARAANGGSAQNFSEGSGNDGKETA